MIKLVATDMDGTFLNNEKQFDVDFINIFYDLQKLGIKFVVASGQQFYRLYQRFIPMSEQMIFIAENGSFVAEGSTLLFVNEIEKEKVHASLDLLKSTPRLFPIVCGKRGAYIEEKYQEYEYEVKKYYTNYWFIDDVYNIEDDIIKIAIFDPETNIKEYSDILNHGLADGLKLVTSGFEWMDITNASANKGLPMAFLQEYYGIQKEECAAFGDQMNDYELLSNVKYAFAVENAVEPIKALAYDIIPSNNEQGVLQKLREIIEKQGNI